MATLKLVDDDWPEATGSHADGGNSVDAEALVAAIRAAIHSFPAEKEPQTVRIRNFRSSKYLLNEDFLATVHREGDIYVAVSNDTAQYGQGPSIDDAIEGLCSVVEEYFEILKEERDSLSPPLAHHLRYLNSVLREE